MAGLSRKFIIVALCATGIGALYIAARTRRLKDGQIGSRMVDGKQIIERKKGFYVTLSPLNDTLRVKNKSQSYINFGKNYPLERITVSANTVCVINEFAKEKEGERLKEAADSILDDGKASSKKSTLKMLATGRHWINTAYQQYAFGTQKESTMPISEQLSSLPLGVC